MLARRLGRAAVGYFCCDGRICLCHRMQAHRPREPGILGIYRKRDRKLSRHEDAGGISVVAVLRDEPETMRFVPWFAIREAVLGGGRGSVKLEEYPETLNGTWEVPHP